MRPSPPRSWIPPRRPGSARPSPSSTDPAADVRPRHVRRHFRAGDAARDRTARRGAGRRAELAALLHVAVRGHAAEEAVADEESAVPRFNEYYLNLRQSYLFAEIRRRTKVFADAHQDVRLIDLGVGDVTQPLPPAVIRAIHEAADDMARRETFRGYGPYVGYEFLRAEIAAHDFGARGVKIAVDEVFVSDGGKSDSANLQEIFAPDAVIALLDPVYPVYADSNVVAGRTGPAHERGQYAGIVHLPCTADNSFQPALPDRHVDLIYLCYPNNPTGAVVTRESLERWVDYAHAEDA